MQWQYEIVTVNLHATYNSQLFNERTTCFPYDLSLKFHFQIFTFYHFQIGIYLYLYNLNKKNVYS